MATLEQLRQLFGSGSDEEAISAASKRYGIAPEEIAAEVGYKVGGKWGNRWSAAVDNYQAGLYDTGSQVARGLGLNTAADALERGRARNRAQADLSTEFAAKQGAVDSYKDIHGIGDAADYVGGLAIQSAPYLAEAAVGGVGARLASTGLRAGLGAARAAGDTAEVSRVTGQLAGRSTAGSVVASYPSSVGDILSNQREQMEESGGELRPGMAFLGGAPYAALNAFSPMERAAARGQLFRNGARALDDAPGLRGGLARAGATGLRTGVEEGLNETGQEVANQYFGRMAVDPTQTLTSPDALDRYGESFVGGAVLGGLAGGAGGGWRRSEAYHEQNFQALRDLRAQADEAGSTDLLNTTPKQLGWNGLHDPRTGQNTYTAFPDGEVATTEDQSLQQRYGMTPEVLDGIRDGGDTRVDPRMASGDQAPYLPRTMVADQGGQVALDASAANSLYGDDAGDPGLAEARRRYLAQRQQAEQQAQQQAAVAEAAQQRTALLERSARVTGVQGTATADLFEQLEQQRKAGVLSEADFVSDAALLSTRENGKVRRNIKERQQAADAAAGATDAQPDVPAAAGLAAEPAPGGRGVAGGGRGDLGLLATDTGRGVSPAPVAPALSGDAAAPVGGGLARDDVAVAPAALKALLDRETPRDREVIKMAFGLDDKHELVNEPMTYEQIGAALNNVRGRNAGQPMTKQAVGAVLTRFLNRVSAGKAASPRAIQAMVRANEWFAQNTGEAEQTAAPGQRRGEELVTSDDVAPTSETAADETEEGGGWC